MLYLITLVLSLSTAVQPMPQGDVGPSSTQEDTTFDDWVVMREGDAVRPIPQSTATARKSRFIRCIGPMARDMNFHSHNPFLYRHPRQLCAKGMYGGETAWNMGGYCGQNNRYTVDQTLGDKKKYQKQNAVAMFCANRCRCVDPNGPMSVVEDSWEIPTEVLASEQDPPAPYDKNPIGFLAPDQDPGFSREESYDRFYPLQLNPEPISMDSPETTLSPTIVKLKANPAWTAPKCFSSMLPKWTPPAPFALSDFQRLEDLCNAQVFGGSLEGNAGGICSTDRTGQKRAVRFLEFLSHPSFLETHLPLGKAVQLWCMRFCYCDENPPDIDLQDPEPLVLAAKGGAEVEADFLNGGVALVATHASWGFGTISRVKVIDLVKGKQNADGSYGYVAGACGKHPLDGCTSAWPTQDIPLPTSFAESGEERLRLPTLEPTRPISGDKCGRQCQSVRECRSSMEDSCTCVVNPTVQQVGMVGASPWLSIAVGLCAPLGRYAFSNAGRSRLNGRDTGIGDELHQSQCACNATYVASACCQSLDGMVFDNPELKSK